MGAATDAAVDVFADIGTVPVCKACGSERVVKDAWACWNPKFGLWELETVFDHEHCHRCEGETTFVWQRIEATPRRRIRELNDRMRTMGQGVGSVVVTAGVTAHGPDFLRHVVEAVERFDGFDDDNDPWGEHDFGSVEVEGRKVLWKIDYYTPELTTGSENPANEGETHRVLTIMLASEY
ncbi:DUF3768 domain-containing protein [Acidimangrovimonas sediminis]|uniref:DUF3768 domain-containing protein n=2 Tax=Albidovulum sediminis TaxID=3066345 RepID=A0ABT2NG80_9RHOB|nr:DUF3768 domain-containing protein [Defluviimonas sediminis]